MAVVWKYLQDIAKDSKYTEQEKNQLFDLLVSEPVRRFAKQNIAIPRLFESASLLAKLLEKGEAEVKLEIREEYQHIFPELEIFLQPGFQRPLSDILPNLDNHETYFIFCSCDANIGIPFYFTQKYVGPNLPCIQKCIYTDNDRETICLLGDAVTSRYYQKIPVEKFAQMATEMKVSDAISASAAFQLFRPYSIQLTEEYTANLVDGGTYDNSGIFLLFLPVVDEIAIEPIKIPNPYVKDEKQRSQPHHLVYCSNGVSRYFYVKN